MLSRHGVPSLLVERHPGTAIHPKARNIHARTMEIFGQYGVEPAVQEAALPPDETRLLIWAESLAGREIERRVMAASTDQTLALSPSHQCFCAQDDLEPVLRRYAEGLGPGTLRFSTELVALEQSPDGVAARLVDRRDGAEQVIRARYVVAADGADSGVRRALGIGMTGREAAYQSVNILLRADLRPWTADRPAALYFIQSPRMQATFLTINARDRWGFLVNDLDRYGLHGADFTPELAVQFVREAVGAPDLPVEILGIQPWTASAQVADQFCVGRIFLAGDAAHCLPPTGGFGMNTGIQDVHNLAWKLAGVLDGWAGPTLLETYQAERLPVGRARTEQSLVNALSMGRGVSAEATVPPRSVTARPEYLNELGLIFGDVYQSTAVIPDGTPPPTVANPVTDYVPNARPGSRAPHLWLKDQRGERRSPHQLCAGRFALLAGPDGAVLGGQARRAAARLGLPFEAWTIGPGGDLADPTGAWPELYGVGPTGAVLLRPDGYVAWRTPAAAQDAAPDPGEALETVLGRLKPDPLLSSGGR